MSDTPTTNEPPPPRSVANRCPSCGRCRLEPSYGETPHGVGTYNECQKCDAICDFVSGGLRELMVERDTLRAALSWLVGAKDEKDAHGETGRYRELKAGAWEWAREVLSAQLKTEPTPEAAR